MVRKIAFFLLLFSACKTSAQNLGFSLAEGQKSVQIPIEVYNNLIVIPVVLNDALPLKFIIDTGVRTAILTQKTFTDILNLPYSRKYTIAGPGGVKLIDAYITTNVSLELPGVTGRGHAMLVLGEDYLELRNYLGTDVHGILGYELFSRFIVEVNYEKKLLILKSPATFKKRRKFRTLPMTIEDTKPYVVLPITLRNGTTLNAKFLMDSGASHGVMLDPGSDSLITVPKDVVSSIIGRGLGGEIIGKVGRVEALDLADYHLEDVIVNFPDPNSYMDTLKMSSVFRNGSIGGEILSRFTVIFNFPKEEVYLKKNSAFKKNFHYNLSGITVKAKGSQLNVFEIREVREKSASAMEGLLPGDIILSINGLETKHLSLNIITGLLNSKPGKRIRIDVERNGQRLKKEFRLTDAI
ncbi:MAG TPA: aspartyl protease family protein [Ohtaekwangia sp.]|nr:aspartyl protease family protein [Ohtaekwangia sp.]